VKLAINPGIKKAVFLLTLIIPVCSPLLSQQDCADQLQEAQKNYDLGITDEIPEILAPCISDGFTRMQKIAAYKLIILSYLFDDNQFEAEKTMVEFLRKFPEYEIMPNDPIEFVYLFESYRTTSVFSFGLTAGFNVTDPRIIEPFTAFDINNLTQKDNMKPGLQVGIGVGKYINRSMNLNIELYFASNKYSFTDELSVEPTGVRKVSYIEKTLKVEVPVTVTYEFTIRNVLYYARAGLSAAKVTGVTGQPVLSFAEDVPSVSGGNIDMTGYRKKILYNGIVGLGVRYKVPRGVVMLDLRYNLGLNNIILPDKRFENQELIDKYNYIDDDFALNTFSISASYYFSFFKPKKQR
jgi:hypothetical protein